MASRLTLAFAAALALIAALSLGIREPALVLDIHATAPVAAERQADLVAPTRVGGTRNRGAAQRVDAASLAPEGPESDRRIASTRTLSLELVDRAARQPVPHLEIALWQDGGASWSGRTDATGRVDAEAPWTDAIVLLRVLEMWLDANTEFVPGFDGRLRVLVPIGPTYLLAGTATDEPRELEAVLRSSSAALWFVESSIAWEPVALVRFASNAEFARAPAPWSLELFDEQGSLFGATPLDRLLGFDPRPVSVDLVECGRAWVSYKDEQGRDIDGASVVVHASNGAVIAARVHESGDAWVRGIPLGRARFIASAPGYRDEALERDVPAGRSDVDFTLRSPLPPGAVSGRVVVSPRALSPGLRVRLVDARGAEQIARPDSTGAFVLDGVPAGTCTLEGLIEPVDGEPAPTQYTTGRVRLVAPAAGVVLELQLGAGPRPARRAPQTCEFALEAVDARTGVRFTRGLVAQVRRADDDEFEWEDHEAVEWGGHADEPLKWALRVEGYRAAYGDQTWFAPEPPQRPDVHTERRVAIVWLEPGWGTLVRVVDAHGSPVPGVPVLVDGVSRGATDERGLLDLALDARPGRLGVGGGLRLAAGGMVDPASGAFGDPFPELVIAVEPR